MGKITRKEILLTPNFKNFYLPIMVHSEFQTFTIVEPIYLIFFSVGSKCFGYRSSQQVYPTIKKSFLSLTLQVSPNKRKAFSNDSGSSTCTAGTVYYVNDKGKNILWCNYGENKFVVKTSSSGHYELKVHV